ncbi:MAG: hypothetical protein E7164_01650 [Firmicutes bacterium]|nr:hypothetical protein [Bacillota bacterium]
MFSDIWLFLKSITFIDYVFFFTVVFLIVLVVSLIYFIKINEEVIESGDSVKDPDNLRAIATAIKSQPKEPIAFTSYEQEQEDKAIISYDELLSNTGEFQLNYVDEEQKGDLSVKKIDLNNLINASVKAEPPKIEVHLISLKREEEFLQTLKELQRSLN